MTSLIFSILVLLFSVVALMMAIITNRAVNGRVQSSCEVFYQYFKSCGYDPPERNGKTYRKWLDELNRWEVKK